MGHKRLSRVEDSDWIHLFESVNKMEGRGGEGRRGRSTPGTGAHLQ